MKNFNISCYLVMVASWRASLSSYNPYYDHDSQNLPFVIHMCNYITDEKFLPIYFNFEIFQ